MKLIDNNLLFCVIEKFNRIIVIIKEIIYTYRYILISHAIINNYQSIYTLFINVFFRFLIACLPWIYLKICIFARIRNFRFFYLMNNLMLVLIEIYKRLYTLQQKNRIKVFFK